MIVIDTSAILAVVWGEPEAVEFSNLLVDAEGVLISAASRLEAFTVAMNRKGFDNAESVEQTLIALKVVTVPFDEHQFLLARQAYERYRAGRKGLNFGDCFAYALAKSRDLPLLFKGDDFRLTDVEPAL